MKVDILTSENVGHLFLDGKEMQGVTQFVFGMVAGGRPQVQITLLPDALTVHSDGAEVTVEKQPEADGGKDGGNNDESGKVRGKR